MFPSKSFEYWPYWSPGGRMQTELDNCSQCAACREAGAGYPSEPPSARWPAPHS